MWLHDLTSDDGFRAGLLWSLVFTGVVIVVALPWGAGRRHPPLPLAGVVVVAAAAIALEHIGRLPGRALLGVVALAVGGAAVQGAPRWLTAPAAVPGGLVLGSAAPDVAPGWVPAFVVASTVIGAYLVAVFDDRGRAVGLAPVLVPVTAIGVYATVPDTEEAGALVGASLPVALSSVPAPLSSLGGALSAPLVGLVAWVAAGGGRGRPGSIVGGTACLGALLLGPVLPDLRRAAARLPRRLRVLAAVGVVHVGIVLVASRVAGLRTSAVAAFVIAVVALVVGAAILRACVRLAVGRSP
jgi:hypothetical protein